jgi:hypothetical protein
MANNYYTFTPSFVPGAKVRANEVNVQYQALETAFDNLPTAVDSLTTGKSTFATESGTGNAYVVTMPDTRTSNADGDEIIFFATHGNTGPATLNVDSIGAVTMVDRSGAALSSGDITSGILYVATYDAANSRFVLDVTVNVVTNVIDVVQGTSTDNPTSPGTFNANLGFENANGNPLADIGYNSDTVLGIYSRVHGGNVVLGAENAAGTLQSLITIDPDTEQVVLPLSNDAATPTLAFGDGDSGFYESADDTLKIALLGSARFSLNQNVFSGEEALAGALLNETASGTNPTFVPNRQDVDTGIGWSTADSLSLIAGGVEMLRCSEAASDFVEFMVETKLRADIVTGSPPTSEAVTARFFFVDNDATDTLGILGYAASNSLTINNLMQGGSVELIADTVTALKFTVGSSAIIQTNQANIQQWVLRAMQQHCLQCLQSGLESTSRMTPQQTVWMYSRQVVMTRVQEQTRQ